MAEFNVQISQEQLERIRRDIVKAFTPKETPVTKHPETTTEWLEDIALELHAITGLLNERLPVVHPGGQSNELNNDDPDEALAQVLWDHVANSEFDMHYIARRTSRALARIARQHIEAERPPETDWEGLFGMEQRKREKAEAELETVKTTLRNVEARRDALLHERDEWKAKYEQTDNLPDYSLHVAEENAAEHQTARWIAEAERDELRDACNSWQSVAQEAEYLSEKFRAERDEYADRAERWEARHAALREDVDREYRRTDYPPAHIALKGILARDDDWGQS